MPQPSPVRRLPPLPLLALALIGAPALAWAEPDDEEQGEEIVAEALFLADTLPAGSRDLNLVVAVDHGAASPVLQLAAPLGDRVGFTVDVGIPTEAGRVLESPGASLKLLLRDAAPGQTGLSASVDVFGSVDRAVDTEVGVGIGALRPLGRLALRATALAATGVSRLEPHLHAGASAALALSPRWRALAEVTAEVDRGGAVLSAGPAAKVALSDRFALMAGALFELGRVAAPVFTVQLTHSM